MTKSNNSEKPLPAQTQVPMYPFKHGLNIWLVPNKDFLKDGSYAFTDDDIEVLEKEKNVGFPLSNKSLSAIQHLLAKKCELFNTKSLEEWDWPNIIKMLVSLKLKKTLKKQPKAYHSPDFRSIDWFGKTYHFTATQAAIVKILWDAWENKAPDIGQAYLLETVESKSDRLLDIFKGHKTYKQLIGPGKT
jgi:hypothetical protein